MEVRTKGPLLCAKFHPHRCNDKGRPIGPPKLKFLLRFDQNVEYKRPSGAYPLRDFHKICSLYHVSGALSVKISLDFLKGLCIVMGVLSWRGLVIPKFSAAPSGEAMRQNPKSFRGARTCSRSSITVPSFVGSDFTRRRGGQKRWVFCLVVCLFVCPSRAFERQRLCARFRHEGVGLQKRFSYRWIDDKKSHLKWLLHAWELQISDFCF